MKDKLLIICGATATGKSELAVWSAKKLNGEIISADSMQIYKNMNIGTAKITPEETEGIKHYMIDVVSPTDSFSVADYKEHAENALKIIESNGKRPIVVGGTGFYINSLIYDFNYGNSSANQGLRDKYKSLANEFGNEYVYEILTKLNPKRASELHPNDLVRVIRAIELAETGAEVQDTKIPIRDYIAIAIFEDREILYDKINKRVDIMFENGLLKEVEELLKSGVKFDNQSMQGIGYKEFRDYFEQKATLDDVKNKIKQNSRNYAKRQFTWFKKFPEIIWCKDKNEAKLKIEEFYSCK